MGLEWHNRIRSSNGRFATREQREEAERQGYPTAQLHIRVSMDLALRVKAAAIAEHMELGAYCARALDAYAPRKAPRITYQR